MFPAHRRYFLVARRDLVYLKFIIEAYEGLAILSTIEKEGALVSITSPSCSAADIDLLIEAFSREIAMTETAPPYGACIGTGGDHHDRQS